MKRKPIFRPFNLMLTLFAAATLSMVSCKDNKPKDTEEVADEQNDEKFDKNTKENDAEFMVDAAEMDLQEIQLGKLAQERSSNADIKAHGKMMVEDHMKSAEMMKTLAAQKNITLPASVTEDGMDAYKKLNDKKAEDFDEAYIDMMVDAHEDAVTKFENNADRTEDPDIKSWATTALGTLRMHLEHSRALQDKMKNSDNAK